MLEVLEMHHARAGGEGADGFVGTLVHQHEVARVGVGFQGGAADGTQDFQHLITASGERAVVF